MERYEEAEMTYERALEFASAGDRKQLAGAYGLGRRRRRLRKSKEKTQRRAGLSESAGNRSRKQETGTEAFDCALALHCASVSRISFE